MRQSRLGEVFVPFLLEALEAAETAGEDTPVGGIYQINAGRLGEAKDRLSAWADGGFDTPSGVDTFYDQPTTEDKQNAV